jgi:hypothetical protein
MHAQQTGHLMVTRAHRKRLRSVTAVSEQASLSAACAASAVDSGPTMAARCGSSSCACSWYLCSCGHQWRASQEGVELL